MMIPAPAKYAQMKGKASLVYDAICKLLSERQGLAGTEPGRSVDWAQFGEAEWRLFAKMAETEGVGPLLYWHFKNSAWPPGIPNACAAALMAQYYNTPGSNNH